MEADGLSALSDADLSGDDSPGVLGPPFQEGHAIMGGLPRVYAAFFRAFSAVRIFCGVMGRSVILRPIAS